MSNSELITNQLTNDLKSSLDRLLAELKKREQIQAERESAFEISKNKQIEDANKQSSDIIKEGTLTANDIINEAKKKTKAMEEEIKQWEEEKKQLAHIQEFEPRIKLDIGGVKYTTSSVTLCRFSDTMIGAMFSGRHELPLDAEGYHFIDRDGTHFRHILNFLRDPEHFSLRLPIAHLEELKREAAYYGLLEVMFPFTPAEPFNMTSDFNQSSTGHNLGQQQISVTQDDEGLWYFAYPSGGNDQFGLVYGRQVACQPTPAICCRQCGGAYVTSDSQAYGSLTFGIRAFLKGDRKVDCDSQPAPSGKCKIKKCQAR